MQGVIDLGRVLFSPGAVFAAMREKPRILGALLAVMAVQVVVGVLSMPFVRTAMRAQMQGQPDMQPEQVETAVQVAGVFGIIGPPIGILIMLLIATLLLWVLVSVVGGEAKFKHLFAVSLYALVPAILLQLVGIVILMLRGAESVTSMQDLQPSLGLDLFVGRVADLGSFARTFLQTINPFGIWQLVLVAIGIERTHDVSRGAAYTASIVSFLIVALVASFFAGLGGGR